MILWKLAAVLLLAAGTHAGDADYDADKMAMLLAQIEQLHTQHTAGQCLRIEFVEQRQFPFRRYPRRLTGVLWIENGGTRMAFEYVQPSPMRIIANDGRVFVARGQDSARRMESADSDMRIFSQLLGNNPTAVANEWLVSSLQLKGESRTYSIQPKPDSGQHRYRSVDLEFGPDTLRSVIVRRDNSVVHHYNFEPPGVIDCDEAAAHLTP